jgi:hypothetical protein
VVAVRVQHNLTKPGLFPCRDHASRTGLLPDFVQYDRGCGSYKPAQSGFLEGNNDGAYFYNAGRIPWRFGASPLLKLPAIEGWH